VKLKAVLAVVGAALLAVLGVKFGAERKVAKALERTAAAEREATDAQHQAISELHKRKRAQLQAELQHEQKRPVSARLADVYRDALERERAAAPKG
jgi:Flp pilus assembly protein TadB